MSGKFGTRWAPRPARLALELAVASLLAFASAGLFVPRAAALSPTDRLTAVSRFDELATSEGSIGTYFDDATGEMVAVLPVSVIETFSATNASPLMAYASSVGLPARTEPATIDQGTIDAIQTALVGLRPSIPRAYGYGFYFDPRSQKVIVTTMAPSKAFAAVIDRYGDRIQYKQENDAMLSRQYDYAPHWGGANIEGDDYTDPGWKTGCTTGFTVIYKGTPYLSTAAHCFPQGDSTYNYYAWYDVGNQLHLTGSGLYMGYVSWQNGPTVDTELIYGSTYQGYIYTSSTQGKRVSNAMDPPQGYNNICESGGYGGTNCVSTVVTNFASYCEGNPDWCLYDLTKYTCASSCPIPGDSGAPYYWTDPDGTVTIAGMEFNGTLHCSSNCTEYASKWTRIRDYFGVSIATS